jgi:hypothetical protein
MDCPKEVVVWNYYDHEHLLGTHNKLYREARILAERNDWSLVYRKAKIPIVPFNNSGMALQFMEGNVMKTFHKDSIGFLLEMEVHFHDLPNDRSRMIIIYNIFVPEFFKIFEGLFKKVFTCWFEAAWAEDVPMRLRRWRVHKLGFKDFKGIDYINKKLPKPENMDIPKYEFNPPIHSLKPIRSAEGVRRDFVHSIELGYND